MRQFKRRQTFPIHAGVSQVGTLNPPLYYFYTRNVPQHSDTVIATFADSTEILIIQPIRTQASLTLEPWSNMWKIKYNQPNSKNFHFIEHMPSTSANEAIPSSDTEPYLGLYMNLTWPNHTQTTISTKTTLWTTNNYHWTIN